MRRGMPILAAVAVGAIGVATVMQRRPPEDADVFNPQIAELQVQVEAERTSCGKAAKEYTPAVQGRIDDLTIPAAELLAGLPGVVRVDGTSSAVNYSKRLVHLRD